MQCPVCKMIYGQKMGTQPPGTMTFFIYPKSLPGFKDCDTITIIYDFQSGIQVTVIFYVLVYSFVSCY